MDRPHIHIGLTHRFRNSQGYVSDMTLNLSGIPDTAGEEQIQMMLRTANTGLALMIAEAEHRAAELVGRKPVTAPQLDLTAFAPEPVADPETGEVVSTAQGSVGDSQDNGSPVAISATPAELQRQDRDDFNNPSIPRADQVQDARKIVALGIEMDAPHEAWFSEPITELGGEGRVGQLTAINAALSGAGFKGHDRFYPITAILRSAFASEDGYNYSSTRELNKAEASIVLNWFDQANHEQLMALQFFASVLKIASLKATGHQNLALDAEISLAVNKVDPAKFDLITQNIQGETECLAPLSQPVEIPTQLLNQEPAIDAKGESKFEILTTEELFSATTATIGNAVSESSTDTETPVTVGNSAISTTNDEYPLQTFHRSVKDWLKKPEQQPVKDSLDEKPETDPQKFTFSSGQQRAIDRCVELAREKNGGCLLVTGKAGAGKSVVVHELRKRMNIVVCAPTGLAAMNVQGVTNHRFFGLNVTDITKTSALRPNNLLAAQKADAIVIDEISMVRADAFDAIDQVLRKSLKNNRPFGGKLIIAVGDMWQLEPVSGKADAQDERLQKLYKSPFWFDAKVFGNEQKTLDSEGGDFKIEVIELNEIFRQKGDPDFIDALNLIRTGDPAGLFKINQRAGVPFDLANPPVSLCFTNLHAGIINRDRLNALPGEARTYEAMMEGDLIEAKDVPVERELTLKVGARVMVAKNIQVDQGNLSNGKAGVVTRLEDRVIYIHPDGWDEDDQVAIERQTWEKAKTVYDLKEDKITQQPSGQFTQFPLKLAYACSIHKSQGMTLDSAVLELDKSAFAHGQVYVALSRVRTFEGLYLKRRIQPDDLIVHMRVKEFVLGSAPLSSLNAEAFA